MIGGLKNRFDRKLIVDYCELAKCSKVGFSKVKKIAFAHSNEIQMATSAQTEKSALSRHFTSN